MATHSSILAWRMLWTEEPGGRHFTTEHTHTHTHIYTHHMVCGRWMESRFGKHVFMNAEMAYLLWFPTARKEIHFQNVYSSNSLGRSYSAHLFQDKQKCFLQEMTVKLRMQ